MYQFAVLTYYKYNINLLTAICQIKSSIQNSYSRFGKEFNLFKFRILLKILFL
jgi:hypothetical protein